MADPKASAVPLVEQLRSVPNEAVLRIDTPNALGCMDTRSIPVGRLCHEAAAALGVAPVEATSTPKLAVWFGPMPESNGKTNWTAILHRGDLVEGHTIARSEYHDRVRYEADCVRYLIGDLGERPDILAYDPDMLNPAGVKGLGDADR